MRTALEPVNDVANAYSTMLKRGQHLALGTREVFAALELRM